MLDSPSLLPLLLESRGLTIWPNYLQITGQDWRVLSWTSHSLPLQLLPLLFPLFLPTRKGLFDSLDQHGLSASTLGTLNDQLSIRSGSSYSISFHPSGRSISFISSWQASTSISSLASLHPSFISSFPFSFITISSFSGTFFPSLSSLSPLLSSPSPRGPPSPSAFTPHFLSLPAGLYLTYLPHIYRRAPVGEVLHGHWEVRQHAGRDQNLLPIIFPHSVLSPLLFFGLPFYPSL